MSDYPATHHPPTKSEWTSIGVHFFSWAAGIALVLAAVFLFRSSDGHPWLRAGLGLGTGVALVVVAERWIAAKYRVTANALDAAGIGILYATLYAMHARWALVPLVVAFIGMLLVTAAAVALATRRGSMFVAILGLLGGFVSAFLLSSTENYPLAVFSCLLALNIGIAWLAARKGWWLLSALSVILTALYEWGWALQAINVGLLPLAAGIFAVFAVVGTVSLWYGRPDDCPAGVRWIAAAAAHLPLLFAVYVAAHLNYGPQYNVLFAFLLIVDAGLLAIVWRGGPKWLHAAGGAATLITFIVWLRVSYTHASWRWLLLWLALFIALYLAKVTPFAGLLFGVFIGIGIREPQQWGAIIMAMLVMLAAVLVVAIGHGRPIVAAIAIALSCVTLMTLHPPLWMLIALHALLFAALFAVAWVSEHHVLAILAVPFFVAMVITAYSPAQWAQYSVWTLLAIAVVPYLLFVAYPLALGARAKASLDPSIAAGLASLFMFVIAWMTRSAVDAQHRWLIGLVPLAEGVVMAVLLWRALKFDPREPRITLLASLTLACFNVALPMLLPEGWLVALWAIEVAALVWTFTRFRHPVLVVWATGPAVVVFFRLAFDSDLYVFWTVYVVCGLAMFAAAYLIRLDIPVLQRIFSVAGLFELWFLINIMIANSFHSANGALNFDFATSQAGENVWYTVTWALIATGLLILGFLIRWPAARGAALALLVAAVLKAFVFDLPHLGGVYLAASLFGLGASLVVVGITLQKFTTGRSAGVPPAG
ncbi:MAG: DUF2339 domain-containing protein [Candidatus Rokubacteria bacterium]|nr:DUF2339 domain-containing protein [Candidatus Rokubacteria bacterium]